MEMYFSHYVFRLDLCILTVFTYVIIVGVGMFKLFSLRYTMLPPNEQADSFILQFWSQIYFVYILSICIEALVLIPESFSLPCQEGGRFYFAQYYH